MLTKFAESINRLTGGRLAESKTISDLYHTILKYRQNPTVGDNLQEYEVDGFKMLLDQDIRHHSRIIEGNHEPGVKKLLLNTLDDDMVVYDIGAHIGYYTILTAKDAKSVISVDPTPDAYRLLQKNIKLNNLENVSTIQKGVLDDTGEMKINLHTGEEQASNSFAKVSSLKGGSVSVPVTTIDKMSKNYEAPDLIKIDVEGAELRVLNGMSEALKKEPDLIIEVHSSENKDNDKISEFGDSPQSLFRLLEDSGYNIYEITENGDLEQAHPDSMSNIYAET